MHWMVERIGNPVKDKEAHMARYLISFGAHAMDDIPGEEMPAVAEAAHEVVEEAVNAGVWVFGGGLEWQKATVVATDGTVADGPYPQAVGGLCVVDVPSREEALSWAAKIARACRCAQEVREFMPDPAVGNARLRRMADQSHAAEGTLARSPLSRAIDEAEVDGHTIVEVLNGIPGARESISRGREQFARGEGLPLDQL